MRDEIVQLAAKGFSDDGTFQCLGEFSEYVIGDISIPSDITTLTGITDATQATKGLPLRIKWWTFQLLESRRHPMLHAE